MDRMDKLRPEETLPLARGRTIEYRGISIAREKGGRLKVNGTTDPQCVGFRRGGAASNLVCFAVLVGNEVLIFEGLQTGRDMLSREQVLEACGLS